MILMRSKLLLLSLGLAVSLAGGAAYYFYDKGQETVKREIFIEKQKSYIDTRRRIDEATRNNSSVDDALNRLRERQLKRNNK
jgi:hypothetical protein